MKDHHHVVVRENKWLGYRRDIRDARDYMFVPPLAELPVSVDLRPDCPPVMDQGQLGSCTAHGIIGALRYLLVIKGGPRDHNMSRLQLYYDERVIEGTIKEDAGAEIRDGIKCAAKIGVAHESLWPYKLTKFAAKPPASVYKDAAKFEALRYERVMVNPGDMKSALAAKHPIIVGFTVFESFDTLQVQMDGIVPMPNLKTEQILGGHCVYVVGYGQKPGYFTCRNSWGVSWGMDGDFFMPEAYLGSPEYGGDFWLITSVTGVTIGKERFGGES